jgi:hypothetical protein
MWIQCIAVVLVLAFPQIAMWLPEALEDKPGLAAPPVPESDAGARNTLEGGDMKESAESDPARPVGEGSADDRRLK